MGTKRSDKARVFLDGCEYEFVSGEFGKCCSKCAFLKGNILDKGTSCLVADTNMDEVNCYGGYFRKVGGKPKSSKPSLRSQVAKLKSENRRLRMEISELRGCIANATL